MKRLVISAAIVTALTAASAQATPIRLDGREADLQEIVDGFTADGASSIDVTNDQYARDEGWLINSIFGAQSRIVMELAGYAGVNSFGVYDIFAPNTRVELFAGSAGRGATAQFDIGADGRVYRNEVDTGATFTSNLFGFYLNTPVGLWFSQSDLNADAADHLVAYQGVGDSINTPRGVRTWGSDMFLLGWEDLSARTWDQDYNDFVVFVSGVDGVSVPEPATLGLLGLGLAGVGVFGRRRKPAQQSANV